MNANRYSATIDYIGSSAAIIALYDGRGEWSGAGRIELKSGGREALYEAAYTCAARWADSKGGMLDRFSVVPPPRPLPAVCRERVVPGLERRPANALCVEISSPMPRCKLKVPDHWRGLAAGRWLASGGSPLVLGLCSQKCPRRRVGVLQ